MVKKSVPDWLNSPLWLTPPLPPNAPDFSSSDENRLRRHPSFSSSNSKHHSSSSFINDSPVHQAPPVEVRPKTSPPKSDPVKESPRRNADAQTSTSSSSLSSPATLSLSTDDASGQAQLLFERFFWGICKVIGAHGLAN